MSRSRMAWLATVSLALAAGASGCALCDECHKIPVPCNGPGCTAALRVDPIHPSTNGPGGAGLAPAPATGAFSTPPSTAGGSSPNGSVPTFNSPPLPDVPADAPASPPAGPAAPEKP